MKIFDIGVNMTHSKFRGFYQGYNAHANDQEIVLNRAKAYGVRRSLITTSSMMDADFTYKLSLTSDSYYTTIGVHPTRAKDPFKMIRNKETNEFEEDNRT
jgi:TatD DNase family protein